MPRSHDPLISLVLHQGYILKCVLSKIRGRLYENKRNHGLQTDVCLISQELLINPVAVVSIDPKNENSLVNFTYEYDALIKSLEKKKECPKTRNKVKNIMADYSTRARIEE